MVVACGEVCAEIKHGERIALTGEQKGSSLTMDLRKRITTRRNCETHAISVTVLPSCEITGLRPQLAAHSCHKPFICNTYGIPSYVLQTKDLQES